VRGLWYTNDVKREVPTRDTKMGDEVHRVKKVRKKKNSLLTTIAPYGIMRAREKENYPGKPRGSRQVSSRKNIRLDKKKCLTKSTKYAIIQIQGEGSDGKPHQINEMR
jgi:hypothetical protein